MKLVLAAVFAYLCAASAFAAPFQNGGFETGGSAICGANDGLPAGSTAIPGWTVSVGNIDWAGACNWNAQEGSHSIDLIGGNTTVGGISQTFDTVPGGLYQVSFYLAGNFSATFPPPIKPLQVTVNGVVYGNYTFDTTGKSAANMGWVPETFAFTATGSSTTIDFRSTVPASSNFAGAAIDDVTVQQVVNLSATPWTGAALAGNTLPSSLGGADGTTGPAVFTYATANSVCCQTGNWNFETTAVTTGPVTLNWTYNGYHGTCRAQATLTPYVRNAGGTTTSSPPVYDQSDAFCGGALPSAGFGDGGQIVLNVVAGDTYGFTMHAFNFDSNGALSGRLTVTTGTSPTTMSLVSSANPSADGATVNFIATIAGNNPTGTVLFTRRGREYPAVAACDAVPVIAGSAVCSTNFVFDGDQIAAFYSGDIVNAGSASPTLTQAVTPAPPLATPVLIRALPAGSAVVPLLIGRVDGAVSTPLTVRLFTGTSCTNGVLGGTISQLGPDAAITTDALGYFGTGQGAGQGQFVAIGVVNPQVTSLSGCVVTAADNDTWPKALRLNGATATVPDWIDAAGKARWYRFSILPGQSVQVTLSGLPADYDLAVFKDIAQAFFGQLAPVNTAQLTKLSAQYAPSAFSPSAFSPSAFSPSAFSPSAFSPSAFSPSAFSPSAFSPSAFSPSAFSPSAFSPSAFSPSAFSPSAFSPSAFSPSAFSPSAFSPSAFSTDELGQAFSSAQTRSIIAASMTPGTGNESVVVNTWNNTGDFYVRVTGRAGAFSPTSYNVSVTKQGTSCAAVTDTAISSTRTASSGHYSTIVLVDSSKTPLSSAVAGGGTLGSKLTSFAQRADVNGVIVDVGQDGRVNTLKAQASSNITCPFAKNLVAFEIKSIVDAYLLSNPLRYVVIIGSDDAIPFFRYPDQALLGPESGYVPPVSSNSASDASLRGNFFLGQDAYGATSHISLRVDDFPIPGVAVGRLIETPTEIAGMIDAYVAANGSVAPTTSLVTGYDFLQDAADAVRVELQAGTGRAPDALITPNNISPADTRTFANGGPWTANDLRAKVFGAHHDVMFLAGHFNANSALAADFKTSMITSELAASDIFTNTLVFSAGCHAGYNLVDTDAINGVTFPLDWAQAFAQKKATLIAGTGYQYGDTDFLEYSERLYLNFAKELRAGTGKVAIGEALVRAKLAYLAATPDVRGLHEKAVLEATLFGLPMLGVNMPTGRTPPSTNNGVIVTTPAPAPSPAATLGLRLADLSVSPVLTPHTLTLTNYDAQPPTAAIATWLSGPGNAVVTNPAEPTLPLQSINVTPTLPTLVLRGVGFRGGTYSDSTVLPLTGAPTTELRGVHTPFSSPLFFPMRLWSTNYFSSLSGGGGTNLLVTPAQHRSLDAVNSTLRQYSGLSMRLFYSDLTTTSNSVNAAAALSDAPTIVKVDATPNGAATTFSAQVVGDPAAAIHEVWVTYTSAASGSGTWTSFNLQQCVAPLPAVCAATPDSRYWKADIPSATLPAQASYIVQAASGTGLVSLDDNLGRYYSLSSSSAAPIATSIAFSPPTPGTVGYGDSPSVTAVLLSGPSPLPGRLVTVAIGAGARTGISDANGKVTIQLPVLSAPGAYPLTASFAGDSAYLPSSVSSSSMVTVAKAAPTLTRPASGVGAVLTALVAGKTQPLIQESVQFLINGPQGVQQVFAITDYNGVAAIPPPGFAPGTYSVTQACFAGNATYAATKLNANPVCGYVFAGFSQISNPPAVNNANSGQAVPLKFSLGGNRGLSILAKGSPASQEVSCTSFSGTAALEATDTPGNSSLQYDSSSDQYTYVWKTDKSWSGTCRVLVLTLNDGSEHRANFQFKK